MIAPAATLTPAARTTHPNGAAGKGANVRYSTYPRTTVPVARMASGSGRRPGRHGQGSAARTAMGEAARVRVAPYWVIRGAGRGAGGWGPDRAGAGARRGP